ncbi:pcrA [Symbiodinium sp. CCMP2456]|nr:pcrA [Symbiodinium sp. CCMP2456]
MASRYRRESPFAAVDAYLEARGLNVEGPVASPAPQSFLFGASHRQSAASTSGNSRSRKRQAEDPEPRRVATPQAANSWPMSAAWQMPDGLLSTAVPDMGLSAPSENPRPALSWMPNPIHPAPAPAQSAAFAGLQHSATPALNQPAHYDLPKATRPKVHGTQIELPDLSPEQQIAVDEPLDCPLLVLAGPGSGKTHFLACRITRALSASPPQVIVAVTYTRKAAAELSQRVRKLAGPAGSKVWISTVHGLALRLLREAGGRRGLPGRAASDQDRRAAARVVLEQPELVQFLQALPDAALEETCGSDDAAGTKKGDPAAKFLRAMEHVGRQKRDGVALEEQPLLASAHKSFVQELRRRRLMDVSEVIGLALSLLDDDDHGSPGLCWAANFVHMLFVDEWQDTDKEQAQFLAKLLAHRTTVTAVGDDDQRIYAWRRGQTSTPAEAFRSHWPRAQLKTLGANKRSLPHLVEASKKLILHNRQREEKELWPARPATTVSDGPTAQVQAFAKETLSTEVRWAAEELRRLRGEGTSWGSFAVLARTNASASFAAQVFAQMSIPTWQSTAATRSSRTSGAARASVVLDLFAYLRLVVDPHHDVSFLRVYNVPRRGVGKAALRCLREQFGAPARPAGGGASSLDGVSALNLQEVVSRAASLAGSTNGGAPGEPSSGSLEGAMGRLLKAPWLGSNARSAQGLSSLAAALHAARRAAQNGSGSAADVLRVIMAKTGLGSADQAGQACLGQILAAAEKFTVCAEAPVAAACVVQFLQDSAAGGGLGGCGSSASAASASEGTDSEHHPSGQRTSISEPGRIWPAWLREGKVALKTAEKKSAGRWTQEGKTCGL